MWVKSPHSPGGDAARGEYSEKAVLYMEAVGTNNRVGREGGARSRWKRVQ